MWSWINCVPNRSAWRFMRSISSGPCTPASSPGQLSTSVVVVIWPPTSRPVISTGLKIVGTIEGDGRRLKQALFNLLSNAIKFTPDGGAVTVSAERAGGEVRLAVTDTGSGIRPEDIERVFGKFETGGGQSGQTGAGLGLSLVKSLIEMHGGWIGLDSELGKGTKVVCHVPLEPPPAA